MRSSDTRAAVTMWSISSRRAARLSMDGGFAASRSSSTATICVLASQLRTDLSIQTRSSGGVRGGSCAPVRLSQHLSSSDWQITSGDGACFPARRSRRLSHGRIHAPRRSVSMSRRPELRARRLPRLHRHAQRIRRLRFMPSQLMAPSPTPNIPASLPTVEIVRVVADNMAGADQLLPLWQWARSDPREFPVECRRDRACALPAAQFRRRHTQCKPDECGGIRGEARQERLLGKRRERGAKPPACVGLQFVRCRTADRSLDRGPVSSPRDARSLPDGGWFRRGLERRMLGRHAAIAAAARGSEAVCARDRISTRWCDGVAGLDRTRGARSARELPRLREASGASNHAANRAAGGDETLRAFVDGRRQTDRALRIRRAKLSKSERDRTGIRALESARGGCGSDRPAFAASTRLPIRGLDYGER